MNSVADMRPQDVTDAVIEIVQAPTWFTGPVADSIEALTPAILTHFLSWPVDPDLVDELREALDKRESGEDFVEQRQNRERAERLLDQIVCSALVVGQR